MLGSKELEQLHLQKQALLLESSLNRYALRAELDELRYSASRMSHAILAPRRFAPLLMGLASLAGFFAFRSVRRPASLIVGVAKAAKWIGPALSLWRSFTAARRQGSERPDTGR